MIKVNVLQRADVWWKSVQMDFESLTSELKIPKHNILQVGVFRDCCVNA